MKIKELFKNYTKDNFQKIVEYNGHKFRYKIQVTLNQPLATVGSDWYHSLSIMGEDGTFNQIQDAKSVGARYSHSTMWSRDLETQTLMAEEIFSKFDNYIKLIY